MAVRDDPSMPFVTSSAVEWKPNFGLLFGFLLGRNQEEAIATMS